ncbi:hypothetical protein OJF2_19030 [Aquisphaera giovannonii]|uniref:Uncharacterized protein n=1 Tax=Aquisphaera giovannonii TaxID=406548 RepID=A0A5B9VYL9_9BACT|nr:hypothetical protein [Aquisphaera giovannonii]QEH33402.1 hypothetical protein OJF2_19030 [Aquisphaera giovannonii]
MRKRATWRGDILRLFALAWAASLLFGQTPVRAAGCHVSDRPALFSGLSWDHWQGVESERQKPAAVRLPAPPLPAYAAIPCHKDVSTTSQPASDPLGAGLSSLGRIEAPRPREILRVPSLVVSSGPAPAPLDRPPRAS